MKHAFAMLIIPAAVALAAPRGMAFEDSRYLYHPGHPLVRGAAVLESETAIGSRESRPFGERGLEQGVRIRYGALTPLTLEAWSAALLDRNGYERGAWSLESRLKVLDQDTAFLNLQLGAGWLRDFQGVSVPRLRLTGDRAIGGWDVRATSLAEIPVGVERRDPVDLIVGLAASTEPVAKFRIGAEVLGEDLEGLWEEEEAEGGAKLLAGPTLGSTLTERVSVRLNASAYYPVTRNVPTRVQPGAATPSGAGFLGRLAVSYAF